MKITIKSLKQQIYEIDNFSDEATAERLGKAPVLLELLVIMKPSDMVAKTPVLSLNTVFPSVSLSQGLVRSL